MRKSAIDIRNPGPPMSVRQHHEDAPKSLRVAVLTVSDTRTLATDTSGALVVSRLESAGHVVADRAIVPDESDTMAVTLRAWGDRDDIDVILLTGGTGISSRDRTFEAVSSLLTTPLPGFGELFRMLSYAEIGPSAMLSRALGGLMGRLVVLVMPGSRGAVELAMDRLILPELPHLVREARRGD